MHLLRTLQDWTYCILYAVIPTTSKTLSVKYAILKKWCRVDNYNDEIEILMYQFAIQVIPLWNAHEAKNGLVKDEFEIKFQPLSEEMSALIFDQDHDPRMRELLKRAVQFKENLVWKDYGDNLDLHSNNYATRRTPLWDECYAQFRALKDKHSSRWARFNAECESLQGELSANPKLLLNRRNVQHKKDRVERNIFNEQQGRVGPTMPPRP